MAHDVFISHSTQDKAVADAACAKIEARGIRCWMAPRDILPSMDWGEAIVDAIGGAKVMVLIFSSNSNTSDQVKREVQNAVGEGVAILPFRIEDVTPIKSLRYFLGTQHWLDALTAPLEQHLDRLADTVSALLAKMSDAPPDAESKTQRRSSDKRVEKQADTARVSSAQTGEGLFRQFVEGAWADGQLTHQEEEFLLAKASELNITECKARQIITKSKPSDSPATAKSTKHEQLSAHAPSAEASLSEWINHSSKQPDPEQRRRDEQFEALQKQLVEQFDRGAFADARESVAAMLRLRPDDAKTREVQVLITQRLVVALGEEAVTIPGTNVTIEMVHIRPGTFTMGSPPTEVGRSDDEIQHKVTLAKGFWLGKYPVTQAQCQALMGSNPSHFKGDDRRPVEKVDWVGCQQFLKRLNAKGAGEFRLPTEAEWEYACRAGSARAFCFGDDEARLGDYGWYNANSGQQVHPAGQKTPNAWGLHDMHGNVLEWCQDWYGNYACGSVTAPTGPNRGSLRVTRGGSCYYYPSQCRSASRNKFDPCYRSGLVGFRLCRDE